MDRPPPKKERGADPLCVDVRAYLALWTNIVDAPAKYR
jgi:hypothetical protein